MLSALRGPGTSANHSRLIFARRQLLPESRNDLGQRTRNLGRHNANQRTLNSVPGVNDVPARALRTPQRGRCWQRLAPSTWQTRSADHSGEDKAASQCNREKRARLGAELLAPVDRGPDILSQFLEIRAQLSAAALDMICYLFDCFAHCKFSRLFAAVLLPTFWGVR